MDIAIRRIDAVAQELLQPRVSIVALVNALIREAHASGASDIHIGPSADGVRVRLRIDGVLKDAHALPKNIHEEVVSRIKVLAGLRTDEHQAAQDGRFRHQVDAHAFLDLRVSIVPTYHGENAVLQALGGQDARLYAR